jgi:hypothetical protein
MEAGKDIRTAGGSMFQTPFFFWEAIPFAGGPGRVLGLLDYWAGDPMDLLTCALFRKYYFKWLFLSI